ncbi:MAG: shikimate kinase [Acidobacteriota bacterium]|nr:shikimate kinase [Acidobacteriota bacterium]
MDQGRSRAVSKIALTGFMGSGKSTIGPLLAERLRWGFLDIDRQMEVVHARPASALFGELGEEAFRAEEARIMRECLARPRTVVALGGAAVDLPENQKLLREVYTGLLVFLDGAFDVLIGRCAVQSECEGGTYRPLLHKREEAHARFVSRREWNLAHADLRIDVGCQGCEQSAREISEYVGL